MTPAELAAAYRAQPFIPGADEDERFAALLIAIETVEDDLDPV